MKKYLAIYEAPCVGTTAEVIYADDHNDADYQAWRHSLEDQYIVNGGYELYQVVYNLTVNRYELKYVTPEMLAEVDE